MYCFNLVVMPLTFHIACLKRHTTNLSGVPLELTWCQYFGIQFVQKSGNPESLPPKQALFGAMTSIDNLGYLEPILVHPVMRQMFANTVQLNWTPDLTPCRNNKTKFVFNCKIAVIWIGQKSFSGIAQILQILQFFHRQSVNAKRW